MRNFNFLAISDIHLGHSKTETSHIIRNLKSVITSDVLSEMDMIIIAGDLFDHALDYSSNDVYDIQKWLISLLSTCAAYNVSIRILEGTPLHDRKQSKNIEGLNYAPGFDIDLLYVDRVWVEKNEKYSLNILYVPDEWHPDPDQTWIDVMEELSFNNLDTVDISVMHGMFEHQLPPNCSIKPHVNARYEGITDRYIIIGHIHQPTFYGKIAAPGSFDRLTHGDEGNKGCWKFSLSENGKSDKISFLENTNAKVYKTIDCSNLSFEAAIEKISATKAPEKSHIRLKLSSKDNALALLEWCKKEFYNYYWTLQIKDQEPHQRHSKSPLYHPIETININSNSLSSLVSKKLLENNEPDTVVANALKILEEID